MAASHHHQQSHHMNNIHRSSPATTNTACGMTAEEEEDDLAALRIAALKTLEERKQKREPRALIVQRNNVLVIEPQDNVNDFRHSPPARRFSRERSLSPVAHRRPRSREASPNLRKISPPPSRWSPRSNCHRRSPSPYHINGGHHSPSHHSWNPGKRRLSPRTHSPRRLSHSPRRRSPVRRRSPPPCRRSPHRAALSPSRRSPRKSPQRSPLRRCSPQRSPPTRRSPRKSPLRSPQRRFSPRRRPRDSSDSRQSKSTRRNGEKRKASPPVPPSSSSSPPLSSRKRSVPSPRRKEPATLAAETEPAVSQSSSKKGRFERFEDSAASDDESCNESLLDELFRETEESTAKAEALGAESIDENSQEATEVPVSEDTRAVYDEDCLLLQADDDMDDLLVDCNAPEPVVVGEKQAPEDSVSKVNKRGEKAHEKLSDERNRTRGRQKDYSSDSLADPASRGRHSRSDRGARVEREENRERKSKVSKDDNRVGLVAEKRKRSRSREKEKSKRKSSRKVSPKPEKRTASSKPEIRSQSSTQSRSRAQTSPETNISPENRERLEARKKKFLQKELKPSQKVISLKKSPSYKTEDSDDVRRVQDRLGEPVKESKRLSPRNEDSADAPSKSTILSRLGPPPASRGNIKDRIGHINTNSLSPIRTPQTATDTAHVKFEVRNRPTLDPKLKIHINLGATLSTGSNSASSKSKKVVCLE